MGPCWLSRFRTSGHPFGTANSLGVTGTSVSWWKGLLEVDSDAIIEHTSIPTFAQIHSRGIAGGARLLVRPELPRLIYAMRASQLATCFFSSASSAASIATFATWVHRFTSSG